MIPRDKCIYWEDGNATMDEIVGRAPAPLKDRVILHGHPNDLIPACQVTIITGLSDVEITTTFLNELPRQDAEAHQLANSMGVQEHRAFELRGELSVILRSALAGWVLIVNGEAVARTTETNILLAIDELTGTCSLTPAG